MKKILLSLVLIASFASFNKSNAQCSGVNITVNNFVYLPGPGVINYNYDWIPTQGNASIEVLFLCNNVQVASLPCIPFVKDSAQVQHNVSGSFSVPNICVGTMRMLIKVWSNNNCGGTSCNDNFRDIVNIPFPVTFSKFNVSRIMESVSLVWQTSSEQNNKGFAIERNAGNGIWQQVGYVATKAAGGNSNDIINYSYNDFNNAKSVSQYRIRQIDIDNGTKFSDIRSVKGLHQKGGIILFPNPSNDGKINILFEDRNVVKNVTVTDIGGRIVNQVNGISTSSMVVDNLETGIYIIRVLVPSTGEQVFEKIVVAKQ
ncbi:MAG: hypothetical protein RIR12_759 [Bacteroidota bacterium]|jgi:hypothetical protein